MVSMMFASMFTSLAHTQTPQETLNQYVVDLQKNPNDNALREKIIKLAQAMKPAPQIPEDAERYMARGAAALKAAKSQEEFQDAVIELAKASLAAPWLPEVYYNLGITQDKAGKYGEAIQSLKLYLVAAPDATDAKAVKNLIYEIEYRQEKAAKESSPEAIAAKKQNEFEALLKELNGARFVYHANGQKAREDETLDIQGNRLIVGSVTTWCDNAPTTWCGPVPVGQWWRVKETILNGPEFSFPPVENCRIFGVTSTPHGKISDDGNSITFEFCGAEGQSLLYRRER
jgi:tetratricopeptide (TPR) repeat protein